MEIREETAFGAIRYLAGTVIMRSGIWVALIFIEKRSRCAQGRPVGRISEQV